MIAAEIYEARRTLEREFPTLDVRVVRSDRRYRHYIVGIRPLGNEGIHVWIWTPIDGFPNDALRLQLTLIS